MSNGKGTEAVQQVFLFYEIIFMFRVKIVFKKNKTTDNLIAQLENITSSKLLKCSWIYINGISIYIT